jgi:hypothetical protein
MNFYRWSCVEAVAAYTSGKLNGDNLTGQVNAHSGSPCHIVNEVEAG